MAVVERDAGVWREQLASLHEELFGKERSDPLAPVRLEVIDRATDEALQRLIEAGLVAKTTRAARELFPASDGAPAVAPLSEEARRKASTYRAQAARKLKMGRLLESGDLADEAREPFLEALLHLARALAVENRFEEPGELKDILLAPVSLCWKDSLPAIREFVASPTILSGAIAGKLDKFLQGNSGTVTNGT